MGKEAGAPAAAAAGAVEVAAAAAVAGWPQLPLLPPSPPWLHLLAAVLAALPSPEPLECPGCVVCCCAGFCLQLLQAFGPSSAHACVQQTSLSSVVPTFGPCLETFPNQNQIRENKNKLIRWSAWGVSFAASVARVPAFSYFKRLGPARRTLTSSIPACPQLFQGLGPT